MRERGCLKHIEPLALACALVLACSAALAGEPRPDSARGLLDAAGIGGGLIVHLGCGDGRWTAALRAGDGYLVEGLDADAENVGKARARLRSLGLDGKVSVEQWTARHLPYVDGLASLVVADDLGRVPMAEVMRVLRPNGVAWVRQDGGWTKTVKARPASIDAWTHYLHDPTNNAVARDEAVGPPRHVRWKAGPAFGRHHDTLASLSALVCAGGRLFYIFDEGLTSLLHYPARWRLVARDAFSGVLLWKRPLASWESHLRSFRSGPPQLPRRLVAVGGRVYVTLGLTAPVTALDAATGHTRRVHKGTEQADEILCHQGVLLVVTYDYASAAEAHQALRRGIPTTGGRRAIVAVQADTGALLWRKSGQDTAKLLPATLAATDQRVLFRRGAEVACAELRTGRLLWRREAHAPAPDRATATPAPRPGRKPRRRRRPPTAGAFYAPTLVVSPAHGVVLSAHGSKLTALSLGDGQVLWTGKSAPDFHAPADLFVADGLVWSGLFAAQGLDPRTGQVRRTLDLTGLLTPGHHPRCHRGKATDRYVIASKRGLEFFDLRGDGHSRNNWVRGGCQYGIMPCNGLVYVPPNACCCYPGALLHGFYALAPRRKAPTRAEPGPRLQRGPAYGTAAAAAARDASGEAWPTFRGDPARSGSSATVAPTALAELWRAQVGGKLSTVVVGEGRLLVASVHQRRVTALDARTGKSLWSFTAGGRVDTPPTLHRGLALFGAADGWVYGLRASDGAVDEQLESAWPAHGSVLVLDGVAYAAAGRSCYLDGGIRLYGLEPATGRTLCETRLAIPHEKDESRAFLMAGVRPDVLVSDGKWIYLQQIKFDKRLVRQDDGGRHLMCHSGLADDTWFYRTFWRLGRGDAYDFPNSYIKHDLRVPFGQLLVFDGQAVCGLQTWFSPRISPAQADKGSRGCMLFGDANQPFTPDERASPDSDYPPGKLKRRSAPVGHKWTARLPFQARAMVLARDRLFVAGWPDVVDDADPCAAPEGRKGGVLWAFSKADGKLLAKSELKSPPVFDGLIAADGRLYLATVDGAVRCMGQRR